MKQHLLTAIVKFNDVLLDNNRFTMFLFIYLHPEAILVTKASRLRFVLKDQTH